MSGRQIAQVIGLRAKQAIGSTAADELFGLLCQPEDRNADAVQLATARGLVQVKDEGQMDDWVTQAIAAQPQAAADFASGKDAAAGRLVGHVMKVSGGRADAKAVAAKLRERLR